MSRLRGDGNVDPVVSPTFLAWHGPVMKEWRTMAEASSVGPGSS
jgi:hypothetical protein